MPALAWLDEQLAASGTSADELVRVELQNQAAMNVTVRNVITSMRTMAAFDWAEFFESVSLVDEALRADSAFGAMDFATRDRYRHAIEELARGSGRSELEVTREAIAQAKRAAAARPPDAPPGAPRRGSRVLPHLGRASAPREGDRLPGPAQAAASARLRLVGDPGLPRDPRHRHRAAPGAPSAPCAMRGGMSPLALVLLGLIALIPASDLAVALVNRSVADLLGPRPLPRLELRDGVPPSLRTLVVMPTLLTGETEIEEHVDRLEIHYLANPDGDVHFALLSDWTDAPTETMPEDDRLLAAAVDGVARLNRRHGRAPDGGERFLLLHRRRVWNQAEGKWMGWERKRGKLDELNRLLRGANDTTFLSPRGRRPDVPAAVRYVITLDADTHLPRGAVNRLVGTMAHPLNQPVFDPSRGPRRRGIRRASTADHAHDARGSRPVALRVDLTPVRPGSIPMPPRSPTSTRISSARARTPARASTTWTRSPPPWPAASRRTRS